MWKVKVRKFRIYAGKTGTNLDSTGDVGAHSLVENVELSAFLGFLARFRFEELSFAFSSPSTSTFLRLISFFSATSSNRMDPFLVSSCTLAFWSSRTLERCMTASSSFFIALGVLGGSLTLTVTIFGLGTIGLGSGKGGVAFRHWMVVDRSGEANEELAANEVGSTDGAAVGWSPTSEFSFEELELSSRIADRRRWTKRVNDTEGCFWRNTVLVRGVGDTGEGGLAEEKNLVGFGAKLGEKGVLGGGLGWEADGEIWGEETWRCMNSESGSDTGWMRCRYAGRESACAVTRLIWVEGAKIGGVW
jgi:hypothetical protein